MALDWSQCSAVESVPGKVSGAWVFRGTRIPVATVFENLEAGASIEEIMDWFDLTREQIIAVLDFVTESRPGQGYSLEAAGDFVGRGIWTFSQDGPWVDVTYDWKIHAEKPLLRSLSFILKPIFAANHRWAMARGEESLRLELARRHPHTPEERARIPAPPGATPSTMPLRLVMAILTGAVVAARRLRRILL